MKKNLSNKESEFLTVEEIRESYPDQISKQLKEHKKYVDNAWALNYAAYDLYGICEDEELVMEIASNPQASMIQQDKDFRIMCCELYTASQAVGLENYEFEFNDEVGVEVRVKPFKK